MDALFQNPGYKPAPHTCVEESDDGSPPSDIPGELNSPWIGMFKIIPFTLNIVNFQWFGESSFIHIYIHLRCKFIFEIVLNSEHLHN